MLFINISILCLYRRLFTTPKFKKLSLAVIIINVLWVIPAVIVETLACLPVAIFWNPTLPGSCTYYSDFWMVIGGMGVVSLFELVH